MTSSALKTAANRKKTKQTEKIPGKAQVQNNAGGYVYKITDWARLDRFLILGTDGGTYYASEHKLTTDNVDSLRACMNENPIKYIDTIVRISESGRAPKNDPAIFALALFFGEFRSEDESATQARGIASMALLKVCRTGTHIFQFVEFVTGMRGWGRWLRNSVADWFQAAPEHVAYQVVKYAQREGWTHKDLLRLSHPKPDANESQVLFRHIVGKEVNIEDLPDVVVAADQVKAIQQADDAKEAKDWKPSLADRRRVINFIADHNLPREVIPTEFLNFPDVWEALLQKMPITATIRNLAKMTQVGLLKPLSAATKVVNARLSDLEVLRKGRVHPLNVLIAARTYANGHGRRGSLEWSPVRQIIEQLDETFYLAFKTIEPTGKRFYLGVDISGSMDSGSVAGSDLTPREAAMAMAMVTMRTEKQYEIMGFTSGGGKVRNRARGRSFGIDNLGLTKIEVTSKMLLPQACLVARALPMGGTDCALPILDALDRKLEVDAFITYTDNETWAGEIHASQALEMYRQQMGIDAKLVAVGMTATEYSIADPGDFNSMNVVGFDSAAPALISNFVAGNDAGGPLEE